MWNRYVAFGFHQFDDCYCISLIKWKKAASQRTPHSRQYKIIWNEYTTYLIQNEEPTNSQLYTLDAQSCTSLSQRTCSTTIILRASMRLKTSSSSNFPAKLPTLCRLNLDRDWIQEKDELPHHHQSVPDPLTPTTTNTTNDPTTQYTPSYQAMESKHSKPQHIPQNLTTNTANSRPKCHLSLQSNDF
jgi:hypothetical protein